MSRLSNAAVISLHPLQYDALQSMEFRSVGSISNTGSRLAEQLAVIFAVEYCSDVVSKTETWRT